MSIEAMKQALEALESWQKTCLDCGRASEELGRATKSITALRQAIEQAEKQEPVAWVHLDNWKSGNFWPDDCFSDTSDPPEMTPLYTVPPQREWQGLTDDEITEIDRGLDARSYSSFAYTRAVEAKLREKNT